MKVLAATDKFKGTATAKQVCAAIGHACWTLGVDCTEVPLADGGEGTLEVFGAPNRRTKVTGPLGQPVEAEWIMRKGVAVIEMARASGLALIGGAEHNDPMAATTRGTGELIDCALNEGAKKIIVCLGGSATTDGGLGALGAIATPARLSAVDFVVACDVDTTFIDAAEVFAPQKGATPAQVKMLTQRLRQLSVRYRDEHGIDIASIPGSGAAGGLAGALAALGATLMPGFDVVAEELGLEELLASHDLVITGEGMLDETSFAGKVVGGVVEFASITSTPVHVIVGQIDPDLDPSLIEGLEVLSLVETHGTREANTEVSRCVETTATEMIRRIVTSI